MAQATLGAMRTPEGWRIEASGLDFAGTGFGARARVALTLDPAGSKPHLDAAVAIGPGQVTAAKVFWPINVMKVTTREWLDRGLLGGRMDSGAAIVYGDLDDWPFRQAQGRFEAGADFSDVDLDYHPPDGTALCLGRIVGNAGRCSDRQLLSHDRHWVAHVQIEPCREHGRNFPSVPPPKAPAARPWRHRSCSRRWAPSRSGR